MSFNENKLKQLCLPTTEDSTEHDGDDTADPTTGPEGDLDFGDLDKLFEESDPFEDPRFWVRKKLYRLLRKKKLKYILLKQIST